MSEVVTLEARNIHKLFPDGFINDIETFKVHKGEIHALLGENGAGKSTLMNMIYGLFAPDRGEIYVDGQEVHITNPKHALALGIGMVQQDFMLIPVFTVLENIVLGKEDQRGPLLDLNKARHRLPELSKQFDFGIDLDARVADLPVGVQKRVEILKALYRQARILVLDEPTAVLTPQETESLFNLMRKLRDLGMSIVFITTKLTEVMQVADRITVMRRGKVVGSTTPSETNERQLAEMMVGRPALFSVAKGKKVPGSTALVIGNLSVTDDRGLMAVSNVFLEVRAGEILGLAGVEGNGQTELVEALAGLRPPVAGHIMMLGSTIENASPRQLTELGIAYIPADRQETGLVLPFSVSDNLALKTYYKPPFTKGFTLQKTAFDSNASHLIQSYGIQIEDIHGKAAALSVENQQKVILAREISRPIRLLIADQPTKGLDVDSIELVHRYLVDKRDQGCAVLLVSTDLDEILSLSDRIAVIYRGRIMGEVSGSKANKNVIGMMMAGVSGTSIRVNA